MMLHSHVTLTVTSSQSRQLTRTGAHALMYALSLHSGHMGQPARRHASPASLDRDTIAYLLCTRRRDPAVLSPPSLGDRPSPR